jgi:hypothetical protein
VTVKAEGRHRKRHRQSVPLGTNPPQFNPLSSATTRLFIPGDIHGLRPGIGV